LFPVSCIQTNLTNHGSLHTYNFAGIENEFMLNIADRAPLTAMQYYTTTNTKNANKLIITTFKTITTNSPGNYRNISEVKECVFIIQQNYSITDDTHKTNILNNPFQLRTYVPLKISILILHLMKVLIRASSPLPSTQVMYLNISQLQKYAKPQNLTRSLLTYCV